MSEEKYEGPSWDRLPRDGDDSNEDDDDSIAELGNPTLASALTSLVDWLIETPDERARILDNRVLEDLYGGRWVNGSDMLPGINAYGASGGDPVKLNFARNAVDFVHTKICAETPSVVASERGGGYQAERRAQLLNEYIDKLIDSTQLMNRLPEAALTALRTGAGILKTHANDETPGLELVPSEWVHVDAGESRTGAPQSIYERRPMSRRALLERWTDDLDREHEDDFEPSTAYIAINGAPGSRDPLDIGLSSGIDTMADNVDVYEGWTLGSVKRPGRHVICVHGYTLLDEDWTLPRFPHAIFGVDPPPPGRGFWAQGLLCQLDEAQFEIDFLLHQVSEQIRLARLKVFVQEGNSVLEDHLADSAQGTIINYSGAIPQFVTPPTVGREALEHIQWLVAELYQTIGMSESASSSQRPAGVNSGRAILFFHDFQTRRYVELVKRYSQLAVDVIDRLLDRADELHVSVDGEDSDGLDPLDSDDRLSWTKVRMDRKDFSLRLEPVSAVPRSYAGRTQRIEQLIAQGQMPEGYWTEYLSDPNAWKAEHRAAAQAEHIEWLLEVLTNPELEEPPLSDKLDFGMALEVLGGEVLTLIRKKADKEVIDRVEDFYDAIVNRRNELQQLEAEKQGQLQAGAGQMAGGAATPIAPEMAAMGMGGLGQTNPS